MELLKYPIGPFKEPDDCSIEEIVQWIESLANFPLKLKSALQNVPDSALSNTYRPGGWTLRQVVHHCADSHMNCFIRFKLALTSSCPAIVPYDENLWANLPDSTHYPIEPSLQIIEGVHNRWTALLKTMSIEDLKKTFYHPEHKREFRLDKTLSMYAWHCEHHLAHIRMCLFQSQ